MKWQDINRTILSPLPVSWQEYLGKLRRYSFFGSHGEGNPIVAMVDGRGFHGGLCDRWKGIVSLYAYAKAVHRDFRIYYTYPFDLRLFQIPNKYDWTVSESALSRNVCNVKLLRVVGEPGFDRMQSLPSDKQIHCYANRDWIELINSAFGTDFRWGELFFELFQPSSLLKNKLQSFSWLTSQPYVAVALRVQNLFGDFAEYVYRPASGEEQQRLAGILTEYVRTVHDRHQCPVLITSDSNRLLDIISERCGFVCANKGVAAHADTTTDAPLEEYLKPMADFYLLAGAEKVYAPVAGQMYASDFPKYAAAVYNHDFERVEIYI